MISLLAFFLLICVLVFVHEYGHFWAARRCGVKVLRFSIGFGKVLWRKTDSLGTEFAFSLIPLGGYVQMYDGEDAQGNTSQALNSKSVWQRVFIVIAGPAANFIFAVLAYWAVFSLGVPTVKPVVGEVQPQSIAAQAGIQPEFEFKQIGNKQVHDWEEVGLALVAHIGEQAVEIHGNFVNEDMPQTLSLNLADWTLGDERKNPLTDLGIRPKGSVIEPIISAVVEHSPAETAGLKVGDHILSVNSRPFDWPTLVAEVQQGEPLSLEIERHGERSLFSISPQKNAEGEFKLGIAPTVQPLADKYRTELKYDMLAALQKSLAKVTALTETIVRFIIKLLTGELALSNMGGPISIAKGAGSTAEIGLVYYLSFMALISVNLGVMNLFPLLPLDGGQLVMLAGEAVRGKPLPEKIRLGFQQLGILLVLSLMIFGLFNDLIHF